MKLPLHINLIKFLTTQGYKYWLTKTDSADQENSLLKITVIPVQKPVCVNLPEGYTYSKIFSKDTKITSKQDNVQIIVNLTSEDFVSYKKFLIKNHQRSKSILPKPIAE